MNTFGIRFFVLFSAFLFVLVLPTYTFAESRPFQASLTPDIAVHDRNVTIEGLALSIWGENPQKGVALGFVNGSTGESIGLSWSIVLNYADSYKGVHLALANYAKGNFLGWQGGFINYTENNFKGAQTGFVNYAKQFNGLQLGFINYAETAGSGVQIGLLNVIRENEWFSEFPNAVAPYMVFVNWRF